jgi:hypothetical protein
MAATAISLELIVRIREFYTLAVQEIAANEKRRKTGNFRQRQKELVWKPTGRLK